MNNTHSQTAHFRVFWKWTKPQVPIHSRFRLFKPNTARDEDISANSQTQQWRTANIWLVVTSSQALFLRRIAESSQPSIILQTMVQPVCSPCAAGVRPRAASEVYGNTLITHRSETFHGVLTVLLHYLKIQWPIGITCFTRWNRNCSLNYCKIKWKDLYRIYLFVCMHWSSVLLTNCWKYLVEMLKILWNMCRNVPLPLGAVTVCEVMYDRQGAPLTTGLNNGRDLLHHLWSHFDDTFVPRYCDDKKMMKCRLLTLCNILVFVHCPNIFCAHGLPMTSPSRDHCHTVLYWWRC